MAHRRWREVEPQRRAADMALPLGRTVIEEEQDFLDHGGYAG